MRSSIRVVSAAVLAAGLGLTPVSAAVNGTQWAVVSPVFKGRDLSFIRFFNGSLIGSSTFTVMVISSAGRTWSANITIPKSASVQYALTTAGGPPNIETVTGADFGDTNSTYAVYIQNPDATAGYQHVTYNFGNTFFENASTCRYSLNDAIITNNNALVLTNVHTANSTMTNWPATVIIHNYWNAAVTYKLTVVDSNTGATLGTLNQPVGANATASLSMQSIHGAIGLVADPSQNHVNIFFTDTTATVPYAAVSHVETNASFNDATFNLTNACAVNPPPNQPTGGGGFIGY
jgi:hypothetical protein